MIVAAQHKINTSIKKILIIQLGDIGDVVWMIPALWAVKNAYSQAQLMILTRHPNADILLDDPRVAGVFQVRAERRMQDRLRTSFQLLHGLRREKFDLVIDLRADDRGAITSFLTGARVRAALFYPGLTWRNHLFTHLVNPAPAQERIFGAAEQSLQIIRGLGIKEETSVPMIIVSAESGQKVRQIIAAENIAVKNGWISINPFSRWAYKEWGIEKWRQLVLFIWQKYALPAVIIGSEEERERAAILFRDTPSPVHNLAGKISLRDIAALLKLSRLHIGVDSAAPHIAAAVGTPTVTIYGPSDWRDWAPPGEKNKVVLPDRDCSPCYKKGCDGNGRSLCLEEIDVNKVLTVAEAILKKDGESLQYSFVRHSREGGNPGSV
jgi:predicted lipopolysaccharide heptosyltransferase III